jgi:hypothetical protein
LTSGTTPGFTADRDPTWITGGPDGHIWFSEAVRGGALARINADRSVIEFAAGATVGFTAGREPDQIATGPDGSIWFTEGSNPGALGRLTIAAPVSAGGFAPAQGRQPSSVAGARALRVAVISALHESRARFAVGRSSTPLGGRAAAARPARGTVFSFRLDEPATVRIAIQAMAAGRRAGGRCRRPTRGLRRRPRCARAITTAKLTRTAHTGHNRIAFSGRLRGRALASGHYRAVFTAANRAGAAPPRRLRFTIVNV